MQEPALGEVPGSAPGVGLEATAWQPSDFEAKGELGAPGAGVIPVLHALPKDALPATEALFHTLRQFHLGDPRAKGQTEPVGADYLPALLNAYRDVSKVRYDYPLFLSPPASVAGDRLTKPLARLLRDQADAFAPGAESARILKDNLARIETFVRQALGEAPVDAVSLLSEAGKALQNDLKLDEENRARLQADLDKLLEAIPADAYLLGYGRHAALDLLVHAIRSRLIPRRQRFYEEIKQLTGHLQQLLNIEWVKSDEAIEPKMVQSSVGSVGSRHLDSAALSEVMDHSRGSKAMPTERRARIEGVLRILQEPPEDPHLVSFIHDGLLADAWIENEPTLETLTDPMPCARATAVFDHQAAELARVFRAARIARLEIAGGYDPEVHDPWFESFNWEAFSQEELLLIPAVIALESAERIAGEGMHALSRLLSSGRPVQILVEVQPAANHGAQPDEDPLLNYRLELGYLGISHRQAVIEQSSPARPDHLLARFLSALDATRTSLHLISTGIQDSDDAAPLGPWLIAGAALEGRAHPFFHVNPEVGDAWALRMDFSDNPQPEVDWPVYPFCYRNDNGEEVALELAFTFADFALLEPSLRDHFRLVPEGLDSEDLMPVAAYLSLAPEEAYRRVPFVWAVEARGNLSKLVVSKALVIACQDRQNYWRALQEFAGIRNQYVELALHKARVEAQAEAAAERERLQAEHAERLEQVRNEAAGEAMQRLTDVLLGLDLTGTPQTRMPAAPAPQKEAPVSESAAAPAPEPETEEEVSFDEPWIDSMLCTSCNDCTNLNPLLFVYNENKQAVIGDPKAGTFAQLVEAAEFCPAHCIHPGKPLNPEEPDLEALIERAAPFN